MSCRGNCKENRDKKGLPHGEGAFTDKNPQGQAWTYAGHWQHGRKHGQGIMVWEDEKNDSLGMGFWRCEDGQYVDGSFVAGVREEYREGDFRKLDGLFDSDGNIQNGQWLRHDSDGYQHYFRGVFTWKDDEDGGISISRLEGAWCSRFSGGECRASTGKFMGVDQVDGDRYERSASDKLWRYYRYKNGERSRDESRDRSTPPPDSGTTPPTA